MRNPKRIKIICELIEKAMMINTDIRFWQLLINCLYLEEYWWDSVLDPFHYEDDRLIECLQKYIKDHSN